MKNKYFSKFLSVIGCVSGLFCAFSTGMFLASGYLYSLPALLMVISSFIFLISILSYILLSHQ